MDFMLLDSSGNAVDAFDTDAAAMHAAAQAITHLMLSEPCPAKIAALTSAVSPGIGTPALSSPTTMKTAR